MIVIDKNTKTDLTLPIMIMLSGMALSLGFPTENIRKNCLLVVFGICDSQLPKEYSSCPLCRSWNIRHKNKIHKFLEPIIIKLDNIIAKFEDKKKEIEQLYSPIRKLNLTNTMQPRSFGCLNFKQVKIKIAELAEEIRKIKKNLKSLIYSEKSPFLKKHIGHERRLILLIEFRAEIKNLMYELKYNKKLKNKRRNISLTHRMPKKAASANLSHTKSSSKLMIKEYELLKNLKTVLKNWMRNLKNFYNCVHKLS